MNDRDEWGKDPSVRIMRMVFKAMEEVQQALLDQIGISPCDLRIRRWREQSLTLFEQAWSAANRIGISMDAPMASAVYIHVLAKTIASEGQEIPEGIVPESEEVKSILKEMAQ